MVSSRKYTELFYMKKDVTSDLQKIEKPISKRCISSSRILVF